ncbi:hypothetical protein R3P38DRAFT_2768561 [Favolaschia claudopus]|uniref:Uncharacterized protein n=1 Tax=Favolaschia claudopus TaxID=2862362 RepID=A0AAW0CT72_9AGAR
MYKSDSYNQTESFAGLTQQLGAAFCGQSRVGAPLFESRIYSRIYGENEVALSGFSINRSTRSMTHRSTPQDHCVFMWGGATGAMIRDEEHWARSSLRVKSRVSAELASRAMSELAETRQLRTWANGPAASINFSLD